MEKMKLEQVLDSKTYVNKEGGMIFLSPREYVEPFLEAVGSPLFDNVSVKTANPVINKNEDETENIAYGRLNIEVETPHPIDPQYKSVLGMLLALDKNPEIKVYSGANAVACMNLTIFNARNLFAMKLVGGYKEVYRKVNEWLEQKEREIEEFNEVLRKLNKAVGTPEELDRVMGKLLRKAGMKGGLGTTPIVQASNRLHKPDSMYYVGEGNAFKTDFLNVYNSITQSFTDAVDFYNKPDKVISTSKLFLN